MDLCADDEQNNENENSDSVNFENQNVASSSKTTEIPDKMTDKVADENDYFYNFNKQTAANQVLFI